MRIYYQGKPARFSNWSVKRSIIIEKEPIVMHLEESE